MEIKNNQKNKKSKIFVKIRNSIIIFLILLSTGRRVILSNIVL